MGQASRQGTRIPKGSQTVSGASSAARPPEREENGKRPRQGSQRVMRRNGRDRLKEREWTLEFFIRVIRYLTLLDPFRVDHTLALHPEVSPRSTSGHSLASLSLSGCFATVRAASIIPRLSGLRSFLASIHVAGRGGVPLFRVRRIRGGKRVQGFIENTKGVGQRGFRFFSVLEEDL